MGNWFASQCCGTRQTYIDQDVESSFVIKCRSSCCNKKWRTSYSSETEHSFFSSSTRAIQVTS